MLHSGSRNIGLRIAEYYIKIAQEQVYNQSLPDKHLSCLLNGTPEFDSYWHDMEWAQNYAAVNRQRMIELVIDYLAHEFDRDVPMTGTINCHHNFAQWEHYEFEYPEELVIIRKGAIEARVGQLGIIPGAMGSKSFIVEGLGNQESFNSAPHGAGRRMSRGQAKRTFTLDDLNKSMEGIVCNASKSTIDEIKGSYKDISAVMQNANTLVRPIHSLTQLLNIKG